MITSIQRRDIHFSVPAAGMMPSFGVGYVDGIPSTVEDGTDIIRPIEDGDVFAVVTEERGPLSVTNDGGILCVHPGSEDRARLARGEDMCRWERVDPRDDRRPSSILRQAQALVRACYYHDAAGREPALAMARALKALRRVDNQSTVLAALQSDESVLAAARRTVRNLQAESVTVHAFGEGWRDLPQIVIEAQSRGPVDPGWVEIKVDRYWVREDGSWSWEHQRS